MNPRETIAHATADAEFAAVNIDQAVEDAGLARVTAGGATWLVLATVVGKGAAFLAQIILGRILSKNDFGLFATALAIGGFMNILRDGGAASLLVQRGPKDYAAVAGPLFWMAFALNVVSALLTCAVAYPIEWALGKPGLAPLLIIFSISAPLATPGIQLQAKLRVDLRFAEFARLGLLSGLLRQVLSVIFAVLGFRALSFVIPYVLCAFYEWAAAYRLVHESPLRHAPEFRRWGGFLRQGAWSGFGLTANYAIDQGPNLVVGIRLSESVVGIFYFAFQMAAQLGVLLGFAMQQALFPIFTRLNDDPQRQAQAVVRSLHAMMLVGSISCVLMSVAIEPIEMILWHGKWHDIVVPVMILGVFFPWRITFGLTTAALQAQGRFKRHALLTLFEGAGLILASLAGSYVSPTAWSVSLWAGCWLLLSRLAVTLVTLRTVNVGVARGIEALFPSWLLACVAGFAAVALDRSLALNDRLSGPTQQFLAGLAGSRLSAEKTAVLATSAVAALRCVVLLGTCALVFLGAARIMLAEHLRDFARVAPGRIGVLASRVLMLDDRPEPDAP